MENYKGFSGPQTIAHVERNVINGFPTAQKDLTGVQYGKLMNVANMSYQDGKNTALPQGYSIADNCLYISDTEQLIPLDIIKKITTEKQTITTKIDCTGSAKHYYNWHSIYYSDGQRLYDRIEAHQADKNNTSVYYVETKHVTRYVLNESEEC
jgi:hypothetical protein